MTGLHRGTITKYLQESSKPIYKAIHRQSQLNPYHGLIEGWLSQQDYQASRIHELVQMQGFKGSYTTVRRYVEKFKQKRDHVAYVRFETLPGQQAQVDFGDFVIECGDGKKLTVYCFIMVLGFSRKMYVEFIDRCTMAKFLACHQRAFEFFGGIPAEVLYDNMKNVVIKKLVGIVQWNASFLSFCLHYGFKPLTTPAYSPWAKGKVERPIQYVRERFWRGYVYNNLDETNKNILEWIQAVADIRIHGTTREKIIDRFEKEQPFLGLLPLSIYDISEKHIRKVHKDCQLSFNGNRYVVPHEYAGKTVLLKNSDGLLRIFYDDQLIATYQITKDKGQTFGHPQFYQRLKEDRDQLRRKYRKPFLKKARATRGLVKEKLTVEVVKRPLSSYDRATWEVFNG
jgi:transposase